MKHLTVLFVSLFFAVGAFAQQPPVQIAQAAGGASTGATVPAASTGATSTIAAVVAAGVAAAAAVSAYNSTSASH